MDLSRARYSVDTFDPGSDFVNIRRNSAERGITLRLIDFILRYIADKAREKRQVPQKH